MFQRVRTIDFELGREWRDDILFFYLRLIRREIPTKTIDGRWFPVDIIKGLFPFSFFKMPASNNAFLFTSAITKALGKMRFYLLLAQRRIINTRFVNHADERFNDFLASYMPAAANSQVAARDCFTIFKILAFFRNGFFFTIYIYVLLIFCFIIYRDNMMPLIRTKRTDRGFGIAIIKYPLIRSGVFMNITQTKMQGIIVPSAKIVHIRINAHNITIFAVFWINPRFQRQTAVFQGIRANYNFILHFIKSQAQFIFIVHGKFGSEREFSAIGLLGYCFAGFTFQVLSNLRLIFSRV